MPLGKGRKAVVTLAKPTDRLKEFAGREEQGLIFGFRLPEGTEHRADLLIREDEFPGSIALYLDPEGRSPTQALAWKGTFEQREDGAVLVHPPLSAGEIEDFLVGRLTEAGLLVLRKEGRVILGAPLFLDGRKDERDKTRMFVREALAYAVVRGEIERRLRYPPGLEPPPIQIPGRTEGATKPRSKKSRAKKESAEKGKAPLAGAPAPVTAGKKPPSSAAPTPSPPAAAPAKPAAKLKAAAKPEAPAKGKEPPKAQPKKPARKAAAERPRARTSGTSTALRPKKKRPPVARAGRGSGARGARRSAR